VATKKTSSAKTATKATKPAKAKPSEPTIAEPVVAKPPRASALSAAARVLAEVGEPMNCQQLIETMATKGYWTSPGGQTPAQTLFAAISREINVKGTASRFIKVERGKFAASGAK